MWVCQSVIGLGITLKVHIPLSIFNTSALGVHCGKTWKTIRSLASDGIKLKLQLIPLKIKWTFKVTSILKKGKVYKINDKHFNFWVRLDIVSIK